MNPSPQQMVDLASRLQSGAGDPAAADSSPNWEDYKRWVGARLPMDTTAPTFRPPFARASWGLSLDADIRGAE
jgi:hypothetical protein